MQQFERRLAALEARQARIEERVDRFATTLEEKLDKTRDELAMVQINSNDTSAICARASTQSVNMMMAKINKTIVPQIAALKQAISYQMEDGNEVVNSYRMEVNRELSGGNNLLTDKADSRHIRDGVSTVWGNDDY